MKKIIVLFCCILILSGCTIKSNIIVNYDGTTTEDVKLLNDTKIFESEKKSLKEIVNLMVKPYSDVLNYKKYDYEVISEEKLSGAKVYKNYDNICKYFGNSAFNQYVYKYMDCIENEYYYEIKNATNYIPYCSDCSDWPAMDDVTLSITLPIQAEEQNADEINGTTYIWKYDKNTKDKNFYLKISKSALKKNEEDYLKAQERKQTMKKLIILGVIVCVIIIIGVIGIVLYKKYKKNKLDY